MTSDQRTSGSGGGYIEQRHLHQEGMDHDPVGRQAQLSITSTLLAPRLGLRTCRQ